MKYKIGDKVVPIGNACNGTKLEDNYLWNKAKSINQPYLIITNYYPKDNSYRCNVNKDNVWSSWWYEENLKLYKNTKQLIKELYEI